MFVCKDENKIKRGRGWPIVLRIGSAQQSNMDGMLACMGCINFMQSNMNVMHIFFSFLKTQQLTQWADTAFIFFY